MYAVDDETMMLHNFVYDGNGKDTFFWAGSSNRPSSKGYIVPDKNGRTNVLGRQVRTMSPILLSAPVLKLPYFTLLSFTVLSLVCRYLNEDFILKLPSEKKIRDLKWFSVYDLSTQVINV